MRSFFIHLFFFVIIINGYGGASDFSSTWLCETTLVCNGRDSVFVLDHHHVIPVTFVLHAPDQTVVPPYRLDPFNGKITFASVPDSGCIFQANYRIIPLQLKQVHRHWTISDSVAPTLQGPRPVVVVSQDTMAQAAFEDQLRKNGSIFRGITIGSNQGMQLESGLRLNVAGTIVPGVEVTASLTDQNTPIQPEGNTQTLQEIDKVFIHIQAPHVETTLGDLVVTQQSTFFGAYQRKLQGITGSLALPSSNITLTAAATKGEFTGNYFTGEEGNQGPYQLTGSAGQREMIVLAGTEKVWIDGELMTRGEDRDYTIDYTTGQVLFTPKRLITDESRITIDFEYSDQQYQKSVYGVSTESNLLNNKLTLTTSFLREADDKNNPLDVTLAEAEIDVLGKAGDDDELAQTSGVQWMGEGKGAYRRQTLDGADYYEYVGANQGDYYVQFSYVGDDAGDYSYQGYGIYRYDGPGQGDYAPIRLLPLATSHQFADMGVTYHASPRVEMGLETAVSDQDLNLFSSADDGDNVGTAYSGSLMLKEQPLQISQLNLGEISLNGNLRSVGNQFRSPGRMGEVEHARKWGAAESQAWGEDSQELNVTYTPNSHIQLDSDVGHLTRQSALTSDRQSFTGQIHYGKIKTLQFSSERIASDNATSGEVSDWLRQSGRLEATWLWLQPGLRYEGEHQKSDADTLREGFRFDEWTGSLGLQHGPFEGSVSRAARTHQVYEQFVLHDDSYSQTDQVSLAVRLKNGFSTESQWTYRRRDYTDPEQEDKLTNLSDIKVAYVHPKKTVNAQLHYQFSSSRISQMVTDTLVVGEGLGQYRYNEDLDELVPDADGDLLLRQLQTGEYIPVNELESGLDVRFDAARVTKTWIRGFQTRSRWRVERKDRLRDFRSVNRHAYQPQWGEDSTIVTGEWSLLQDVEYALPKRSFSCRYRYRQENSENHQLVYEGVLRRLDEHQIQLKGKLAQQLGYFVEAFHRNESKDYFSRPASNRDILLDQCSLELSYRPKQVLEFALQAKLRLARDRAPEPETEVSSLFWKPRMTYAIRQRGQLRLETEIGQVSANPENRTLPYEMLSGDQTGQTIRWTCYFSYKLSGHVTATLQYRGRKEPWREGVYQTGTMEVRAFF